MPIVRKLVRGFRSVFQTGQQQRERSHLGSAALKLTGYPFAGVRFPQCINSTCCLLTQIIKMTPGERRSGAAFQQLTDEEFCFRGQRNGRYQIRTQLLPGNGFRP